MADEMKNAPVVGMRKRFPRVFGRYILEKSLSRGGMGEVMLAVARHVNERCVIKTIRTDLTGEDEFVGRFADEAKIMVRIEHPNIIRVFDAGKVDHDYYIAMQYVHGRDLGDVLDRAYERGEPMPQGLGVYITEQLLRGLDYVHNLKDERGRHMGLVHRDISPQNVLIGFDGSVKLIDFGLARTDILPARTQGALAVGKYGYMSPEQARHQTIDGRADIYSTGVMLFEVFTGDRLVDEQDQSTLWQRVLNPKHRSPRSVIPSLPEAIERLVMKAVEVDPEQRFDSARQMREFASRLNGPDSNRESLTRYLRYLYPKVDFKPPAVPKFDELVGGTEQSIIIATSDKGALSVFGRGALPIEWTMQLDSKMIRNAVEESRRKAAAKRRQERDEVTEAQLTTRDLDALDGTISQEPTLLRGPNEVDDPYMPESQQTSAATPSMPSSDDRTQVTVPPSSRDGGRFERASTGGKTPPIQELASLPRSGSPYRDDEMTVMMNAPPKARLFEGDTPTRVSKPLDDVPSPSVHTVHVTPPMPKAITSNRRGRAIKERHAQLDRAQQDRAQQDRAQQDRVQMRPEGVQIRPEVNRSEQGRPEVRGIEGRPWRKKAIEVHRRTVPVEPVNPSDPRQVRETYAAAEQQVVVRQAPIPWTMWGLGLLGLAFLIGAAAVFAVAF